MTIDREAATDSLLAEFERAGLLVIEGDQVMLTGMARAWDAF